MTSPALPPGTVLREPTTKVSRRVVVTVLLAPILLLILSRVLNLAAAIVLILVAIGFALLVAKDALLAVLRWHSPKLQVSAAPYALGETATVVYTRRPRRVLDVSPSPIQCVLVCEERVTYTQGTDTRTDTRKVSEYKSTSTVEGTAEGLEAEIEMTISADRGAPSFKLPHNEVRWFVEITIDGPRLPRDTHTFPIQVAPVLDASQRAGIQDS